MSGDQNNGDWAAADSAWLDRTLNARAMPTAALEANILASFDAYNVRRNSGLRGFAHRLGVQFRDAVWPGAPVWQPAAALAFSLVVGLAVGVYEPYQGLTRDNADQTASISLDQTPEFDLGENS